MANFFTRMFSGARSKNLTGGGRGRLSTFFNPVYHAGEKYSYEDLLKHGYNSNGVMRLVIDAITDNLSSIPILVQRNSAEADEAPEIMETHPIAALLKRPNPMQSGNEFLAYLYQTLEIAGEVFILNASLTTAARKPFRAKPSGLTILRPDYVKIRTNRQTGAAVAYVYQEPGKQERVYPINASGLSLVKHIKQSVDPLDPSRGSSRYSAVAYEIDLYNEINKHNTALVRNGAKPAGIISVDQKDQNGNPIMLTPEQKRGLERGMEEKYGGSENAGKTPIFSKSMNFQQVGISPKDMDYRGTKEDAAIGIAGQGGVPPQIVGIAGVQTYANVESASLGFLQKKLAPLGNKVITDELGPWLLEQYGEDGKDISVVYKWDEAPAMAEHRRRVIENMTKLTAAGIAGINEARKKVGGFDQLEVGGDEPLVNQSLIPLSQAELSLPSETEPTGVPDEDED